MTDDIDVVRENRARRAARRQGLTLTKVQRRDRQAPDWGRWLIYADGELLISTVVRGIETGGSLEDVERYLATGELPAPAPAAGQRRRRTAGNARLPALAPGHGGRPAPRRCGPPRPGQAAGRIRRTTLASSPVTALVPCSCTVVIIRSRASGDSRPDSTAACSRPAYRAWPDRNPPACAAQRQHRERVIGAELDADARRGPVEARPELAGVLEAGQLRRAAGGLPEPQPVDRVRRELVVAGQRGQHAPQVRVLDVGGVRDPGGQLGGRPGLPALGHQLVEDPVRDGGPLLV